MNGKRRKMRENLEWEEEESENGEKIKMGKEESENEGKIIMGKGGK